MNGTIGQFYGQPDTRDMQFGRVDDPLLPFPYEGRPPEGNPFQVARASITKVQYRCEWFDVADTGSKADGLGRAGFETVMTRVAAGWYRLRKVIHFQRGTSHYVEWEVWTHAVDPMLAAQTQGAAR